ncbi:uncharacterized protein DNG_09784 [Cephalotrichum gorgonifer]|uniref:Uncharacterized protein n=1 Tax=Cephalotrichum gorgonifer TaxID=2041049 RepID=A0AAE8N8U6_9PEZI|nr:uncharacterized protein DNG_09784 [Cephalotrichum gorgonifer]
MPRLPPAEKLPLAVRKNVRDQWQEKKAELEEKLSSLFGTTWTIDIDPLVIYPYAEEWAQASLGEFIYQYVSGAIGRLESFVSDNGPADLNKASYTHTLTLDFDEASRFSYCGVDIHEGKLRLLFAQFATNIDDTCDPSKVLQALNEAPPPPGEEAPKLSVVVQKGIRDEYEPAAESIRSQIAEILQKPDFKVTPGFEGVYEALSKENGARDDWQGNVGPFVKLYFEAFVNTLRSEKFGEDDLLQEGFNEAVEKEEVAFRIVDKLVKGSYNEPVVEDGVLYLQTTPQNFGTNIDDIAAKLIDLL